MTRLAWLLGNWISGVGFAFRLGWQDGECLRPGTKPQMFRASDSREDT